MSWFREQESQLNKPDGVRFVSKASQHKVQVVKEKRNEVVIFLCFSIQFQKNFVTQAQWKKMVLELLRSLPVTIRTNLNMWLTFPFLWEKTFKGGTLAAVKTLALNLFIRRTNSVETVASPSLPRGFSTAGHTPDLGRPSLSRWEGCSLQTCSDSVSP